MSPEASALETEIAVRRFRRRHGAGKLRDCDGVFFVANVDDPIGKINLVAVGIGGFAVRNDEAAFEDAAINGVEGDAHSGILRGRFESADFLLVRRIRKIENDKTVAAECSVAAVAALLKFFRNVHRAVQTCKRSLIRDDFWRNEF